jgi:hypothetical protein
VFGRLRVRISAGKLDRFLLVSSVLPAKFRGFTSAVPRPLSSQSFVLSQIKNRVRYLLSETDCTDGCICLTPGFFISQPPPCANFLKILGGSTSWKPRGLPRLVEGQLCLWNKLLKGMGDLTGWNCVWRYLRFRDMAHGILHVRNVVTGNQV